MRKVTLKTVAPGIERLASGHSLPRHRHLAPYAIAILRGAFEQVGYAGRVRVSAGDLLVQPALDAHANTMRSGAGAMILRLEWRDVDGLGGARRIADLDAIVRAAERDPDEATALAREQWSRAASAQTLADLPDILAAELAAHRVPSLAAWADGAGVARETVSRSFTKAFGVSARQFRSELKARAAWLRIVQTRDSLAAIATDTGFADQAHMTRNVTRLTGASPGAWRREAGATLGRIS